MTNKLGQPNNKNNSFMTNQSVDHGLDDSLVMRVNDFDGGVDEGIFGDSLLPEVIEIPD